MTAVYDVRELGCAALFEVIKTVANFTTAVRKFETYEQVTTAARPALRWLEAPNETRTKSFNGGPSFLEVNVQALIYWDAQIAEGQIPATQMNFLLASFDEKMRPNATTGRLDLGLFPAVQDCYVEGEVFKDSGDMDGTGMIAVPIKLLLLP